MGKDGVSMRIFNEDKTEEIMLEDCDLSEGRLVEDKILLCHHEAIEYSPSIQHYEEKKYANGGVSRWLVVDKEAVEPQPAWDEMEDIYVYKLFTEDEKKEILRKKREKICFTIVDRGELWYKSLSEEQIKELTQWYNDWLSVTETMTEPSMPAWLK